MLSLVPYDGLFLKEHRALFDEGRVVAFAVYAESIRCTLRLISMLLPATTTYSIGPSALFFAMSKFMAFEAAYWKRDVRSHWYCKVTSSQACRRFCTIKSQDDCVSRNLNVLMHMNGSDVGDAIEFLHKLFLRTVLEVAMLNDILGNV